jgi:hypothetical protein
MSGEHGLVRDDTEDGMLSGTEGPEHLSRQYSHGCVPLNF